MTEEMKEKGRRKGLQSVMLGGVFLLLAGCGDGTGTSKADPKEGMEEHVAASDGVEPHRTGASLPPNHPPVDLTPQQAENVENPDDPGMPLDRHPPEVAAHGKDIEVVVPDSVKEKWGAVQLGIVEEKSGNKTELTVPVGGDAEIDGAVVTVAAFLPDYTSDFEKATSASEELNNPAVLIEVSRNGTTVAKGWVFKNFPEFNTFSGENMKIELLDVKASETGNQ